MLSALEEIALIARCVAADDRHAFSRLVQEYQEPLRRFLVNLTGGDPILAADLSQETFIKAYTSIRSFRGVSRFKTWLYRIACNEYYSYRRSSHPSDGMEAMADTPCDSDYAAMAERKMDISAAIQRLSDDERAAILLFYMEDMPIRRISAVTGMPEGTVKSHLSRAKSKLGRLLNM